MTVVSINMKCVLALDGWLIENALLFIIYMPVDIDNNGFLDSNDFECMALRACIIEGKGECNPAKLSEYQHIMRSLWEEISDLADFDKVCMMQKIQKSFFDLIMKP